MTHHGDEASNELEVLEVVGVDVGRRVDLQAVVVLASVFEQAVHGVENLVGQQEEPLSGGEEEEDEEEEGGQRQEVVRIPRNVKVTVKFPCTA